MSSLTKAFYDYFEERPLSGPGGGRRRNVDAGKDRKALGQSKYWRPSYFVIWYYNLLEGENRSIEGDHREAAWVMTAKRIYRYVGDPGTSVIPLSTQEIRARLDAGEAPPDPDSLGPRARVHHYCRFLTADDLIHVAGSDVASCAFEVTEHWHNPNKGVVSPIPDDAETLGTHCVAIAGYSGDDNLFRFPNSWGTAWGEDGVGAISPRDVDRFMVEGYASFAMGIGPIYKATSGKIILLWKSSVGGRQVHGRELVDAATGERMAWCFLVRRGQYLDIEELFVWPTHRRHGHRI